ncbi:signal peptidase II [Lacipirellula sp.]|uniref:signal peptidase II n=1 Tax=Lacipirellula sp. TaxID=2691419 RepID=UPI003D0A14FE
MERNPSRFGRILLGIAVLASSVGCDQATKRLATTHLRGAPARSYLADTVRLEYALNPAGFLSVGANLPARIRYWVFTVTNAAMLSAVAMVMLKCWNMRLAAYMACSCLLAGGVGNMIDRMLQGGLVTDFIIVDFGALHTGVFNVADVAIMFGGIAIAILHSLNRIKAQTTEVE